MRVTTAVSLGLLIASGSSALAKNLPRSAAARPAAGCQWAGPGFVKADGSDTCVKVSGSVRAEYGATATK